MTWRKTILTGGAVLLLLTITLGQPQEAVAATPPMLTTLNTDTLLDQGCEQVSLSDSKALGAMGKLDWWAVVPGDATGKTILFCPASVRSSLQPLGEGQVAAWISLMSWDEFVDSIGSVGDLFDPSNYDFSFSNPLSALSDALGDHVALFFNRLSEAGNDFILAATKLIPPLLTQGDFIGNNIVRESWPVVLGAVNGVFLLALVLIALLTVLRLEVSGGAKRLLPRLLIAALLVNFSLVIAGMILDVSRIVMALVSFFMGTENLDQLPNGIVDGLGLWNYNITLIDSVTEWEGGLESWGLVILAMLVALLTWFCAAVVLLIVIGLLTRYVMLVFLLIISPLAYVFMAFPGTAGLAKKWWTTFMRYVIYGPMLLMLLLIGIKAVGIGGQFKDYFASYAPGDELFYMDLMSTAVFLAFLILAALAGRYAGIVGASATIGLALGAGRRLRGAAYRGAKGTGRGAAKAAYGAGRGAAKATYVGTGARRGLRNVRDYAGERLKPWRKRLGIGEYSPYNKEGKKKIGKVSTGQERGILARSVDARSARAAASGPSTAIAGHAALTPVKLGSPDVMKTLRQKDIKNIMDYGTQEQQQRIVAQVDIVRKMDEGTIASALANVNLRSSVEAALRQINRQDNA